MILGVMRFIVCPQLWAFAGDVLKVPGWGIRAHPVAAGCPSDAVGHWLVPCLCSCICPLHLSRMILPPQVRWDPSVSSACTGPSLLHVVSCNISPLSTSRMLIMRYLCMFFFWFFSPFRVCSDSWICRFMSFVKLGSCQTLFCLCGTPPPRCKCSVFGYCPKFPEFLFTYFQPLFSLGSEWVSSVGLSSRNQLCPLSSLLSYWAYPANIILFYFSSLYFSVLQFYYVLFMSSTFLLRFPIFTHFSMIIHNSQVILASHLSWQQLSAFSHSRCDFLGSWADG